MKKANTLRVQGGESLIIVNDNAVIQMRSGDIAVVAGITLLVTLCLGLALWFLFRCLASLEQTKYRLTQMDAELEIRLQGIGAIASGAYDLVEARTVGSIKELTKEQRELLGEWAKLKTEVTKLETEVKVLNERLVRKLDHEEPVVVNEVAVSNPF